MSEFYDEMRAVTSDVFGEFKQGSMQLVRMTRPAGSTPDDPGEAVPTPTDINATARPVSQRYINGTHIDGTETEVSMPNDGTEPQMDDFVNIDGVRYKIVRIMRRPAAGTAVSFTLIVKR